jgi:hypothetical protein
MKRWLTLLFFLLTGCGSLQATGPFGLWQPQGVAVSNLSGSYYGNPSAIWTTTQCQILANPCMQLWVNIATGGSAGVYYFESANGLTGWTAYSGNPILSGAGNTLPTVYLESGTYYIYVSNTAGSQIQAYTSSNGVTSLTSQGVVLTPGSSGAWDQSGVFQINVCDIVSGTWFGYYTGQNGSGNDNLQIGMITSTNGLSWTKYSGNPVVNGPNGTAVGAMTFYKTGNSYYAYADSYVTNSQFLANGYTVFYRWSAPAANGPWTPLETIGSVPIPTYYVASTAEFSLIGPNSSLGIQVGDPRLVAINGNIYLYYTLSYNFGAESGVYEAEIPNMNLTQLVATNEGVLNVPVTNIPQTDLVQLGSDNGTGANANPIGGNWTTVATSGNFGPIQRVSNQFQNSSASTPEGTAYWNAATWTNDQYSQVTFYTTSTAVDEGAVTRASTSGAATCYNFFWNGNIGSAGSWFLQKVVAGSATTIVTGSVTNSPALAVSQGDTFMDVVIGTTHYLYYDNLLFYAVSDSAISSGAPGMMFFNTTTPATAILSAWAGGNFIGSSPFPTQVGGFLVQ